MGVAVLPGMCDAGADPFAKDLPLELGIASSRLAFERHVIDGGVAVEDALAADLDGDGHPDLIAGGRATHIVEVYWNRPAK
jgi:hypothetical protein